MINYDDLLSIDKIMYCYQMIRLNTKHRKKLINFELFYNANIVRTLDKIKDKNYHHSKYSIFLIYEPKARIIMSENIYDKIINHLVSKYVLFPLLGSKLIESNIATRPNKGTKAGIIYMKKYINKLKENYNKIYVLKMWYS